MLETAEAVTAAAWDARRPVGVRRRRRAVGVRRRRRRRRPCFDGAVEVAKACIQVLGGIGFTYEHDAHLYLRRALAAAGAGRRRPTRRPSG